ncbi:MAG: hydrolase [Bacteroidota bacterium]|jgi:ADP-ribose pyrophosphatase
MKRRLFFSGIIMSKEQPYSTLQQEILHKNPYWKYVKETYVLADGHSQSEYYYVHTHGSTIIIPLLNDTTMIMVKQYRYLNQRISIEFPGGGISHAMEPRENALKELREETGIIAGMMKPIGTFNPCNGITNELCTVYIARELHFTEQDTEETEEIEIIHVPLEECASMIKHGEIWDGMTLASWTLFQTLQS